MRNYFALVHHEPATAFGISFPDVPGCFAASDDERDLFEAAAEALSLFFASLSDLPRARTLREITEDEQVAAEMKQGAVLIAVPFIASQRKERINVTMAPALVESIDKAANVAGVSRSEFIAEAVQRRLRQEVGAVMAQTAKGSRQSRAATGGSETQPPSGSKDAKAVSAASKVLKDPKASKAAKSAAASALTQKKK